MNFAAQAAKQNSFLGDVIFWVVTAITAILLALVTFEYDHLERYAAAQNEIIGRKTADIRAVTAKLAAEEKKLTGLREDIKVEREKLLSLQASQDAQKKLLAANTAAAANAGDRLRALRAANNKLKSELSDEEDKTRAAAKRDAEVIASQNAQIQALQARKSKLCDSAKAAKERYTNSRHARADSVVRGYVEKMLIVCTSDN